MYLNNILFSTTFVVEINRGKNLIYNCISSAAFQIENTEQWNLFIYFYLLSHIFNCKACYGPKCHLEI